MKNDKNGEENIRRQHILEQKKTKEQCKGNEQVVNWRFLVFFARRKYMTLKNEAYRNTIVGLPYCCKIQFYVRSVKPQCLVRKMCTNNLLDLYDLINGIARNELRTVYKLQAGD